MTKKKFKKKFKNKIKKICLVLMIIILLVIIINAVEYYLMSKQELVSEINQKESYNLSDFGFVRTISKTDYNNNKIDDYTDFLNGAKKYAEFNPKYLSAYYANGYPPVEKEGVCTDVIWYSLKEAGYSLKDMIARDIRDTVKKDIYNVEIIDDNIDFRRVEVQEVFFQRYAISLDTDIYQIGNMQPGDIITFEDSAHVAIISDKYNKNGVPYVIQNSDEEQTEKEEDVLEETEMQVTGHYRFKYTSDIGDLINRASKT